MGQREPGGEAHRYRGPLQSTHLTATHTPTAAVICAKKKNRQGSPFLAEGERDVHIRDVFV